MIGSGSPHHVFQKCQEKIEDWLEAHQSVWQTGIHLNLLLGLFTAYHPIYPMTGLGVSRFIAVADWEILGVAYLRCFMYEHFGPPTSWNDNIKIPLGHYKLTNLWIFISLQWLSPRGIT